MARTGVLPKQTLRELCSRGYIEDVGEGFLNPASIDLPLSPEAYRLEREFLVLPGRTVRSLLSEVGATSHDLTHPLEVGVPYLIRIGGKWRLPDRVFGYANPKSSIGRTFLLSRVLADNVPMYDALTGPGWAGELWVLVRPERFPVLVSPSTPGTPGTPLSQVRLFDGTSFLDPLGMDMAIENPGLLFNSDGVRLPKPHRHADSMFLSVLVGDAMGWECRGTNCVLDLSRRSKNPASFFEPISMRDGAFDLRKGSAYILATAEHVMVPPELSAELRTIDPRFGDFRAHLAGYIDPGWGWGEDGKGCGRPITLEVMPHENLRLWPGQYVARVRYEHMKEPPDLPYDAASTSNYNVPGRARGPALAKYFEAEHDE